MDVVKNIVTGLGLPAFLLALLTGLYNQGLWSWIPLAIAVLLGVYAYVLRKRWPSHLAKFEELKDLNDQKNQTYASLQRRLARAAVAMPLPSPPAPAASLPGNITPPSRWHASLGWAEAWFSRHLGADIWTYAGFNKLLLFALVYPLVFLLLTWLLTDMGQMGQATVLPSHGLGWRGFFKRLGLCAIVFLPLLPLAWAIKFRPAWIAPDASGKDFLKVAIPIFVIFLGCQYVLKHVDAGVGAGIVAFAFAFAFAGAFVGAFASAVAFVVAGAFSGAVAVSVSGAFIVAVVVVFPVAIAVFWLARFLEDRAQSSLRNHVIAVLGLVFVLTSVMLTATYLAPLRTTDISQLSASKPAFTLLLFIGILPLCNAVFDWLSVGVTRLCLRSMAAGSRFAALVFLADLLIGIGLTVGLFALVLQILQWMQAAGWGVDAKAIFVAFRANPLDPQVAWIAMLALTNMLPTLIHLAISFWGIFSAQIRLPRTHVAAQVHSLLGVLDANGRFVGQTAAPASLILNANGQTLTPKPTGAKAHQAISPGDLDALFNYLYVDYWLVLLTVLGVVVALWSQYLKFLAWVLGLFL
jgi:hypothetical protein